MSNLERIPDICKGCHITFKLTLTKDDGSSVNVDGGSLTFLLKKKLDDENETPAIEKTVDQTEADLENPTGVIYMPLTDVETNIATGKHEYSFVFLTKDGVKQRVAPIRGQHDGNVEVYA